MIRVIPKKSEQTLPPPLPQAADESIYSKVPIAVAVTLLTVLLLSSLFMLLSDGSNNGDSEEQAGLSSGPSHIATASDKSTAGIGGGTSIDAGSASEQGRGLRKDEVSDIAWPTTLEGAGTSDSNSADSSNVEVGLATDDIPAAPPRLAHQFFAGGHASGASELATDSQAEGDGKNGEFFGIAADGRRFVYVVDKSSSMSGESFEKARNELLQSIKNLKSNQSFFVIFYDTDAYPQPTKTLERARRSNILRVNKWIEEAFPQGGTDPMPAIRIALSLNPDAVYILSDGEFDASAVSETTLLNTPNRVVIHTIAIQTNAITLQMIAEQNGGAYRLVP